MSEYIDKAKLYNKLREREGVIQKRVDETPATINGALSPCYTRYSAQLNEVTRCRELVADFPTEGEWIPISEKLPKNNGVYLVTIVFDIDETESERDVTKAYFCSPSKKWQYFSNNEVIAWMPLPEPYKAEMESEE